MLSVSNQNFPGLTAKTDKNTASAYARVAGQYDSRWRPYLEETLERACRTMVSEECPLRLLDVGCGTGELIRKLLFQLPEATLIGVDPAFGMIEEAKRKFPSDTPEVEFLRAPAEALPFPDQTFDWVTCCSSLHCFSDAPKAIGEMARVLKSGGSLLLMDWCRDSVISEILNRWCAWFDPTHVWMYTVKEMHEMLESHKILLQKVDRFRVPWSWDLRLWEMAACVGRKVK